MPALVNYRGDDDYHTGRSLCSKDSTRLLSVYPSSKRQRISDSYFYFFEQESKPSIDILPDECLYEIFRRLPYGQARSSSACVSSRWLTVLSTLKNSETVQVQVQAQEQENDGFLTRCLEGKKATDCRLQSIAIGTSARGGLGRLSVRGSDKVTKLGFTSIARGCPSLKILSLWNIPSVCDESLTEIAKNCQLLEKLDLSHCPLISDTGISAIVQNCPNLTSLTIEFCEKVGNESLQFVARNCPNLESITIKNCPGITDHGIAKLFSSPVLSLKKVKLQSLNITDFSLAVIGHYGKSITNLSLIGLQIATQKGFWAMGNAKGLQSLTNLTVISCFGMTDLGLESIGNGCGFLKQMVLKKCYFVSDNGLISFTKASESLECLQLEECNRITQLGFFGVLKSKLKSLTFVKCMGINDFDFVQEKPELNSTHNGSLRSLTVKDCIGFGNMSLSVISYFCSQLQNLELSGLFKVTDSGLFPLLENCKTGLVKVNFSNCLNLTDKTVADLSSIHGGTLKVLNLGGGIRITDDSLAAVSESCVFLNDLDVSKCNVTDNGIRYLSEGVQIELKILSLSGCRISNKSAGFLEKLGRTLVGLNIRKCNFIGSGFVDSLVENLWRCDILY